MTTNIDNQYCPAIVDSVAASILDNPTLANVQEQLERLTDIEKLLVRSHISQALAERAGRLDQLIRGQQ